MKINITTHQFVISRCSGKKTETGGIIGGKNGVVSEFVFDEGLNNRVFGCYYPDTALLNRCLSNWQHHGIEFYGIVHSHFQKSEELSSGDKEYINSIMMVIPPETSRLYFPLVFPNDERIIPFLAKKIGGTVKITRDEINIV